MRFQFKSVLIGMKSCLSALRTIDGGARPSTLVTLGIESEILNRVFLHGLDCFEYYFVDSDKDKASVQKDDKDVVEAWLLQLCQPLGHLARVACMMIKTARGVALF